jgi:hypothetical protein
MNITISAPEGYDDVQYAVLVSTRKDFYSARDYAVTVIDTVTGDEVEEIGETQNLRELLGHAAKVIRADIITKGR